MTLIATAVLSTAVYTLTTSDLIRWSHEWQTTHPCLRSLRGGPAHKAAKRFNAVGYLGRRWTTYTAGEHLKLSF